MTERPADLHAAKTEDKRGMRVEELPVRTSKSNITPVYP
jgi:hypothetical protein